MASDLKTSSNMPSNEQSDPADIVLKLQNGNKSSEPGHELQFTYSLWFNRRVQGARTQENYEKNIKKVGTFTTVEEFWGYYSHLIRPNELPNTSDYHLFKDGIKPMWEDDANKNGGKWILRLKKGQASRYWEDLILAVIGEQFEVGNEICGAVVSIRYQEDILSVWNRNATDSEVKARILETMKRVLPLDGSPRFEYKNHDASIRDNSSFRNTDSLATPPGPSPSYTMRRDSRDRGDKGERERYERGEKGERSERYDRTDKGDRYDREKGDRGDRFEKSERGDRFDREKGERGDRYDRGDRFERGDRGDRDRPEKGDSKSDKLDWTDKSDPSLEVLLEEHTTPDKKLNMDSNSNRRFTNDKQPVDRRPFLKKPRVPIHQPK